jgi:hypothetical protein
MAAASVIVGCGAPDRGERVEVSEPGETEEVERPDDTFAVGDTLWSVGTLGGAPEQQFGGITDAAFDGEGNVYLLDLVTARCPARPGRRVWEAGRGASPGRGRPELPRR